MPGFDPASAAAKSAVYGTMPDVTAAIRALANLDQQQQQAVLAPAGPVCIIAGAGTGKTTALVARIAYQVASGLWDGPGVLALTHSTKAAGNMRDRLRRMGDERLSNITAKTFHAVALGICRDHWHTTGRDYPLSLADSPYPAVREVLRRQGVRNPETSDVMDLANEISWAKSSLVTPAQYAAHATHLGRLINARTPEQVAAAYQAYDQALEAAGKVDFSDLLLLATQVIASDDNAARAVRARWRHLLVDEYQDTDPAQDAFTTAILGGRQDITVVGDARQSIYRFKGASEHNLNAFVTRYPRAVLVRLVRDYRSTPQIVAAANRLMSTPSEEALIGCQPDGPEPRLGVYSDEADEAQQIARSIASKLRSGTPASQVAVLYRFNAQSAPFESALAKAGVPYTVLDSERFFDRPEITAILRGAWALMLDSEREAAGGDLGDIDPADRAHVPGAELVRQAAARGGFDRAAAPAAAGGARERWEAINALLELVESGPRAEDIGARELLGELALRKSESHQVSTQTVTLSTLHKAKGLEWDVVYLPRMVEGSLPSAYATSSVEVEEEQRLAYVGITRAAQQLHLSYAQMRGSKQKSWPATPSRFLTMLGMVETDTAGTGGRGGRVTKQAPVKTTSPASLDGADLRVFEDLKSWRAGKAKDMSMPAFVVASDAVLANLAKNRPSDRRGLLLTPGLGTKKVDSFGQDLLRILAAHPVKAEASR